MLPPHYRAHLHLWLTLIYDPSLLNNLPVMTLVWSHTQMMMLVDQGPRQHFLTKRVEFTKVASLSLSLPSLSLSLHVCHSLCLFLSVSVCLSICLSVLSVCLSVCLSFLSLIVVLVRCVIYLMTKLYVHVFQAFL